MTDDTDQPLPAPLMRGTVSSRCLSDILRRREPEYERLFKPGQEILGHYYLPPFQRPPAWTPTQSARLVESVHLGISIGGIVVSDAGDVRRVRLDDGTVAERFADESDWLIDGQQRLRALSAFVADEFAVFVGTPHEHRFSDLSQRQRRRFMGTTMGYTVLEALPVEELARIYDLLNYGGTAHTEDQRASGQVTT